MPHGVKLQQPTVHPMPQSSLLCLVELITSRHADHEEDLPRLLVDAANPHVDPALGVLEVNRRSLHHLGHLKGLYDNPSFVFNPEWQIPQFPHIHLKEDIREIIPSRKWSLLLPARLYTKGARFFPLHKAIKDKYPLYTDQHIALTTAYLLELYIKGILYKRHSSHVVSFCGVPYSWEHRILLKPNPANGWGTISTRSRCRCFCFTASKLREQNKTCRGKNRIGPHCPIQKVNRSSCQGACQAREKSTHHSSSSSTASSSTHGDHLHQEDQRQKENPGVPRDTWSNLHNGSRDSDSRGTHHVDQHYLRLGTRIPSRITGGIFLVDKNPRNNREARLVVDFSQFSRLPHRVRWPKFASPNLTTLANKLPLGMSWVSLDVSAAFYHIPMHPGSIKHTLVAVPGLSRDALLLLLRRIKLRELFLFYEQREVLLCLHEHRRLPGVCLGFRKAPMGIGLSPFLLAIFSSIIVQYVRACFQNICAFAYMDDVVVGCKSDLYLASVVHAVHNLLAFVGIRINPEKTRWSGTELFFLGYRITHSGIFPSQDKIDRLYGLLECLTPDRPYDLKILQRLTGHLAFFAPFTQTGYALLQPLYQAISQGQGWQMSKEYITLLRHFFHHLVPVRAHMLGLPKVFSDATPTTVAYVNYWTGEVDMVPTPDLPIHVTELIAACWAVVTSGAKILGVDNTVVASKKMTKYPWLLACVANIILRDVSMLYVPSEQNPADLPSRGLLMLSSYPDISPYRVKDNSHISLHVPKLGWKPKPHRQVSFH
uniref:Protein P n=1 Tax=Eastern sea garfish hepatitis B virus TaxID=2486220 RepID=A0A3G4R7M5_9HEPA|nr:RNA-dependent RNA-polymerase [Eastern sea garfish hepatitis B virus]